MPSNDNKNSSLLIHKVSQSYVIIYNYFINYVGTIKGNHVSLNSAKSLVSKNYKDYENLYQPVSFRIIKRKDIITADIVIHKIYLNNEHSIQVSNVEEDTIYPNYLYLEVIDESNIHKIHIFNLITALNLKEIQTNHPLFGSKEDEIQHQYLIPTKMTDVVCSIHTFCLPSLGKHVLKVKEEISEQLKNVVKKVVEGSNSIRTSISNSFKGEIAKKLRNSRSFVKAQTRSISPGYGRKNISLQKYDTKSQSIENLLLLDSVAQPIIPLSRQDYKLSSTNELQKCFSTHSSLNENENNSITEQICYYKFEHVLQDKCGLKHFKNFLSEEFSSENIDFWEAVNDFSKLTDEDLMKQEAQRIFCTYMDPNSTEQNVNLEKYMIENVRNNLDNPRIDIFDIAKYHTYHVMKNDSYTRFLKSTHFDSLIKEIKCDSNMISATSSSSLSPKKKKKFKIRNIFKNSGKPNADASRKSSIVTIDSDISGSSVSPNICEITLAYDDKIYSVNIDSKQKLSYYLKKIDRKINQNDFVVYDKSNYEIIHFDCVLYFNRALVVDHASLIRVGYVSDPIDTKLFEDFYFVVKCRSSMPLFELVDLISEYLPRYIDKYCIIQENNPKLKLEYDIPVGNFNHSILLLMESNLFDKAKFNGKLLRDSHDALWKRITKDNNFYSNLPFNNKNVLDSRCELFKENQLSSRQVGFKTVNKEENFCQNYSISYDDQRGTCTEDQFALPDFLKSSHTTDIDTTSDVLPENYEIINDFN